MKRRQVLQTMGCAAGWFSLPFGGAAAVASSEHLSGELRPSTVAVDLSLPAKSLPGQARILLPRLAAGATRAAAPALILLHGKGEAADTSAALAAWQLHYGADRALFDLRHGPLAVPTRHARYFPEDERARLNAGLRERPFGNLILICPVTPDPDRLGHRADRVLGAFADWLLERLVPEVRQLAPLSGAVGLDGCSMGGRVALEVMTHRSEGYASFGVVQPAMGAFRVPGYANALQRAAQAAAPPAIRLLTSSRDPYREATRSLSAALRAQDTQHTLVELPGPHTQPWLRAAGTPTTLYWHERRLRPT